MEYIIITANTIKINTPSIIAIIRKHFTSITFADLRVNKCDNQ